MIKFDKAYNVNPKGRKTSDCVIRAIAYASCQSWEKVFEDLCVIAKKKCSVINEKSVYEEYLDNLGFEKHKQPKWDDGTKFTVYEGDRVFNSQKEDVIVSVANHLTCIDNNELIDTWNCRNKCIGNYWTRPKTNGVRPLNNAKPTKTRVYL